MDISAIFTESGPGSVIALSVYTTALLIFIGLTRWILTGGKNESEQ